MSSHQTFFSKLDLIVVDGSTLVTGNNSRLGAGSVSTTTPSAFGGNIYGNLGSLTYLWEYVSGEPADINTPNNLSTTFTRTKFVNIGENMVFNGIYRIKITDTTTGNIIYGLGCTVSTRHRETS